LKTRGVGRPPDVESGILPRAASCRTDQPCESSKTQKFSMSCSVRAFFPPGGTHRSRFAGAGGTPAATLPRSGFSLARQVSHIPRPACLGGTSRFAGRFRHGVNTHCTRRVFRLILSITREFQRLFNTRASALWSKQWHIPSTGDQSCSTGRNKEEKSRRGCARPRHAD
jgi:hypothetical protein